MQTTRSFATALGVAFLGLACGGHAHGQGDVLYPGSTVPGDVLRGEGVAYKGAAVFYLNAAKARSVDADTVMRYNEYVYRSYQEYLRQRAQRLARSAANKTAGLAEIRRRLRDNPGESDLASGDALNVVLVDLSNPAISPTLWARAKTGLPGGTAAMAPFQYASSGGVLSLRRLNVGDSWPVALRYRALEPQRLAYGRAVAGLMDLCRRRGLTPEAVEAVGVAAKELKAKAAEAIPASSVEYRNSASRTTELMERSARALTRSDFIEDLLAELDGFRGEAVADLVDLMRRYNLHFAPAESPEERGLYQSLYPLLVEQRRALGIDAGGSPGRGEARSPTRPSPEVERGDVKPNLPGVWSRLTVAGNDPDVLLLPDGILDDDGGKKSWTYDGKALVMTWVDAKDAGKSVRIGAVVSEDGRSYSGTYKNGTKVWGRKLRDLESTPPIRRIRLTMDAGGECEVEVDPGAHDVTPGPVERDLAGLSGARVVRGGPGRLDILHDFREAIGVEEFGRLCGVSPQLMQGLSIDRGDGTLVLGPVPTAGEVGKKAVLSYPRSLRPPLALTLDLERFPPGTLAIQVEKLRPDEKLAVRLGMDAGGARLEASWHPLDLATRKRAAALPLYGRPIGPDRPARHGFRLPAGAVSPDDRFTLKVIFSSESPARLRSIEVDAGVVPYFGAELGDGASGGVPIVKSLMRGSPAERSGLRSGDEILMIAGTTARDVKEALALLGRTPIGEQARVEVRRDGKPVVISVKAE